MMQPEDQAKTNSSSNFIDWETKEMFSESSLRNLLEELEQKSLRSSLLKPNSLAAFLI